ncbi:MAG TPA: PTS transporter subunit EIIB [Bacilli bacterium]|nr:PTS transporter subunit EIIB [Bacilli bacterium]
MSHLIQYLIIIPVLIIISLVVLKLNRKNFSTDINKLIKYLGGKDNIINASCSMSRLKVILKDVSLADKEGIQKLGAKGVVEIDNQLKIIFSKNAKQLKKYISEML